mgnify:CR=1 FL=1
MAGLDASDCGYYAADERSGEDRRKASRRAFKRTFDPLFAATLVRHTVPAEPAPADAYASARRAVRAGLAVNLRA